MKEETASKTLRDLSRNSRGEAENFCNICPRHCGIDRTKSIGFCGERQSIKIAKIIKNFMWEEPCITGGRGALAIFFSGCNLRCDYCQNYEISRGGVGKEYTVEQFAMLLKENEQTHSSIDLVTPTHFSAELARAFAIYKPKIPVVWNTGGYETAENIKMVSKFVDVFLTDLKYADDALGAKFSKADDYFSQALAATKEMRRQKPDVTEFLDGAQEFMRQGLIIRHLVLPGEVENSLKVLDIIKRDFPSTKISIMSQFTPNGHGSLKRKLNPIEYKLVLSHMEKLGLTNGYIQDFGSANDQFVPDFGN